MTERKVRIETENLKTLMEKMISKTDEILEAITNIEYKIEDSVNFFDTPTAEYFRQNVFEYLDRKKLFINNNLRPLIESLNTIANVYEDDLQKEMNLINNKDGGINV